MFSVLQNSRSGKSRYYRHLRLRCVLSFGQIFLGRFQLVNILPPHSHTRPSRVPATVFIAVLVTIRLTRSLIIAVFRSQSS